jgi:hypothetical protein
MARQRRRRPAGRADDLTLCDSAGRPRIFLGFVGDDEAATLQLSDTAGGPRAVVQVAADGRAVVSLAGADGQTLLGFGADEAGEVGVSLTRPGGVPVLSLTWSAAQGLQLWVWDREGRPVWQASEPGARGRDRPPEGEGPSR